MKLSVLDWPASTLEKKHTRDELASAIEDQTSFGIGAEFPRLCEHAVMDLDWDVSPVMRPLQGQGAGRSLAPAARAITSWSSGTLTVLPNPPRGIDQRSEGGSHARFDLEPGTYLALLSHSGSRGTGAAVCKHYSDVAMGSGAACPTNSGTWRGSTWIRKKGEYWDAMNLMGEYAAANHACIHRAVLKHLG